MNHSTQTAAPVWRLALIGIGLFLTLPTWASSIQSLRHNPLSGDSIEIVLKLDSTPPEPLSFTVDNPARLAIDLPGTEVALDQRYHDINSGPARAVAIAAGKGRSRVVVELLRMAPYDILTRGNELVITIGSAASKSAPTPVIADTPVNTTPLAMNDGYSPAPPRRSASARRNRGEVVNVDFRRGEKGEGRVQVELSNPRTSVDLKNEGGQVVATFPGIQLPQQLAQQLDVIDFATPVKLVSVTSSGGNAQIRITPTEGTAFDQTAYQAGNSFTIELQPISAEEREEKKKKDQAFSGERITLNFQQVDVRSLLQIIADVAQTNIVVDDSVKGDMSLRLDNVPWDQALDIVLKARDLGKRQSGNVIFVAPAADLARRDEAEFKAQEQRVTLAPLVSELIQVNYAKAADIAAILKPSGASASAEGGASAAANPTNSNSIVSERGRVTVDTRTNTLLIVDTREQLADIRNLVKVLDVPVRQVLIESRVVIATDDFSKNLGTRLGYQATNNSGATVQSSNFGVNLPASGPVGTMGLALLGVNYQVNLELQAMQAEGKGEIVSNPRVVTTDRKQASIKQGFEIPYQSSSANTGTSVQFKEALLELTVTPAITPDDNIIMDLKVTKNDPNQARAVNGQPALDKRELNNQVKVKDGETVVLGGVFESTVSRSETGVPVLQDIPLVGKLFRNTADVNAKRELLIFITPKILRDAVLGK